MPIMQLGCCHLIVLFLLLVYFLKLGIQIQESIVPKETSPLPKRLEKWDWDKSKRNWDVLISSQISSYFSYLHLQCFHRLMYKNKMEGAYQNNQNINIKRLISFKPNYVMIVITSIDALCEFDKGPHNIKTGDNQKWSKETGSNHKSVTIMCKAIFSAQPYLFVSIIHQLRQQNYAFIHKSLNSNRDTDK